MIPLRDTIRSRTTPYMNYLFIGMSVLVFFVELTGDPDMELLHRFAVVPAEIHRTIFSFRPTLHSAVTLFSSAFLHGGIGHLIGNMLFLYVFGDNVEDRLGHGGYTLFFLLAAAGAALVESWAQGPSEIPLIGASGAIAGVLGAYFLLYPRARVLTLIPLFFVFPVIEVSAWIFLGVWFLIQVVQAGISLGQSAGGGIAWAAHAGGFFVGAAMLPLFLLGRRLRS